MLRTSTVPKTPRVRRASSAANATIAAWTPASPTTRQLPGSARPAAPRDAYRTGKGLSGISAGACPPTDACAAHRPMPQKPAEHLDAFLKRQDLSTLVAVR